MKKFYAKITIGGTPDSFAIDRANQRALEVVGSRIANEALDQWLLVRTRLRYEPAPSFWRPDFDDTVVQCLVDMEKVAAPPIRLSPGFDSVWHDSDLKDPDWEWEMTNMLAVEYVDRPVPMQPRTFVGKILARWQQHIIDRDG